MVNIQDLPNEILVNICEQLDDINLTTRAEVNSDHALHSADGSKKSLPGLPEFRLANRQMNEIGTYVMFQKVTLWPDHKSWKDLNSIAADPTLSGAVRYLMLENVALVKHVDNEQYENEQEGGKFDEVDLSLFPNLVQVVTNHWSAFRKETAVPRKKKNCILQMPRANALNSRTYNISHLQVLQMLTADHDFQISWLNFSLLLDLPFMQACGNVLQTDNLAQLRCMKIAYGMSVEPGQALDPSFPSMVATTMKKLPRLESIILDHKWWSWHWRPTKLIDLLSDHDWPNLRSCILKVPFATCSQIKSFLQSHICELDYLRIEGLPQNDGMSGFCTRAEARTFRLWLESEFLAEVWEFVDLEGEPAGLEQGPGKTNGGT